MLRGLLVTLVLGCGRIGFEPSRDGAVVADVAPWRLIQSADVEGDARTATVRVQPIGADNLVVVAVAIDAGNGIVNAVTDSSGCNAYVPIANALAHGADLGETLALFYAVKSCPGAVSITATGNADLRAVAVWEVAGIDTTDPLDVAGALDQQPRSSRVLGPMLTTSAPGDFVVAAVIAEFFITNIHAGDEFVNDLDADGNGWAHLVDARSPAGGYQAEWDELPAGLYCASAAAFRAGQ